MGYALHDESVSGGRREERQTRSCAVCTTVFREDWPPQATDCDTCGVPLCGYCLQNHVCLEPVQQDALRAKRMYFYTRMGLNGLERREPQGRD